MDYCLFQLPSEKRVFNDSSGLQRFPHEGTNCGKFFTCCILLKFFLSFHSQIAQMIISSEEVVKDTATNQIAEVRVIIVEVTVEVIIIKESTATHHLHTTTRINEEVIKITRDRHTVKEIHRIKITAVMVNGVHRISEVDIKEIKDISVMTHSSQDISLHDLTSSRVSLMHTVALTVASKL